MSCGSFSYMSLVSSPRERVTSSATTMGVTLLTSRRLPNGFSAGWTSDFCAGTAALWKAALLAERYSAHAMVFIAG